MKFYRCDCCGKIVTVMNDTELDTSCCGRCMRRLVAGTEDASAEKHVPVWRLQEGVVTVHVGTHLHPMMTGHFIEWIVLETHHGHQEALLGSERLLPEAQFAILPDDSVVTVYAYCNLHGLWRSSPGCRPPT